MQIESAIETAGIRVRRDPGGELLCPLCMGWEVRDNFGENSMDEWVSDRNPLFQQYFLALVLLNLAWFSCWVWARL